MKTKFAFKLSPLAKTLAAALAASIPASAGAQSATFTFDTAQTATPMYAPRNVVAVWVEKPNGAFVRTLAQWAMTRKQYLLAWNTASAGNNVDAVTGATWPTHGTRTVSWNLRDVNKALVPNGNYVVKMELTDRNATATTQNNEASFPFTVGTTATSMMVSSGGFTKVLIAYSPAGGPPDLGTTPAPDLDTSGGLDGGADASVPGSMGTGCSLAPRPPRAASWAGPGIALGLMLLARTLRRLQNRRFDV